MKTLRNETLRDKIATIIQTGHINGRTSCEVANQVLIAVKNFKPQAPRPSR